ACGLPVIATKVGGSPEVVSSSEAGILMQDRSPQALIAAVCALFANAPERAATRQYAERFAWGDTTRGQLDLFSDVIRETRLTQTK
ncbi:MAG: glycosyltransferase, partial [Gammaproteobacteria bacterium]